MRRNAAMAAERLWRPYLGETISEAIDEFLNPPVRPHCHAVNRLRPSGLAQSPNCGKCHQPLCLSAAWNCPPDRFF